ncbi:MAG: hypothetical protein J2P18_15575 [Nocardia sp.]|nr:hypothetical protein [Nocardia sp.]
MIGIIGIVASLGVIILIVGMVFIGLTVKRARDRRTAAPTPPMYAGQDAGWNQPPPAPQWRQRF